MYIFLLIGGIISITLYYFMYVKNYEPITTVQFESTHTKKIDTLSELCRYGDAGLIYPLDYHDKHITIKPYQSCNEVVQKEVCRVIYEEWKIEAKLDDVEATDEYITENFTNGDIFYVCVCDDIFVGTVAIDTKNFHPFFSHLYVAKPHRKKGYGKLLVEFAETYARHLQFHEIRLWCDDDIVGYYEKLKYSTVDNKNGKNIMQKKFL